MDLVIQLSSVLATQSQKVETAMESAEQNDTLEREMG